MLRVDVDPAPDAISTPDKAQTIDIFEIWARIAGSLGSMEGDEPRRSRRRPCTPADAPRRRLGERHGNHDALARAALANNRGFFSVSDDVDRERVGSTAPRPASGRRRP